MTVFYPLTKKTDDDLCADLDECYVNAERALDSGRLRTRAYWLARSTLIEAMAISRHAVMLREQQAQEGGDQ